MKKLFVLFLSFSLIYSSCSNDPGSKTPEKRVAKGNRVYGGTFRANETDHYQTLYVHNIKDVVSSFIATQIYEGLVKFNNKDLSIRPSLADKWEIDSSKTIYTFYLKKGVLFQDNECFSGGKGREVKASDFKYSFEMLCSGNADNDNFSATFKDRVLGANKYYEESKAGKASSDIEGIKVVDDYTLQIKLIAPSASFLNTLATPAAAVIAKEAFEKYGKDIKIGTGPFVFVETDKGNKKVVLVRNENYHAVDSLGNQLPYLDSVIVTFLPTKKEELEEFKKGNFDMVLGLPSESVREMIESQPADFQGAPPKYLLDRTPEMVSQYYEFNLTRKPFDNVKVRKAFSYAINRNRIIDEVLRGEAYGPGINGICPPAFKGYDISKITGYDFDAEKAKKLMAEAGYPGGKGFPTVKIELNSGGSKNSNVAFEIQKQLMDVLGVNVDLEVVPLPQRIEDQKYAKADIFRSAWVADYPSPENFLWTLYGASVPETTDKPSYPNIPRYKNAEYDKEFELGKNAKTVEESYEHFMKAEQIMMNDAPIMVLWYDENYRLTQSHVKNFFANAMRYRDLSEVYLKDTSKAAAPAAGGEAKAEEEKK